MPKRSNEDSQSESEPAAKRFANQNENEIKIIADQKLQAARTALARLDYKNTQQICTELINSNYSNPSVPLILRSLALEKQNLFESSAEDAERALKLKESKKTHLRCSFAYLAHALYHLDRALDQSEDDQEEGLPISEFEIEEFCDQVDDFKSLEAGNLFKKRVSEDLLLQMASFLDSPSLAIFSATSKGLRSCIHGSRELFRAFKMEGKGDNLTAGINYFNQRCGDSIRSIDMKVKNKLDWWDQHCLESAISSSASTLESISIRHQGDLCKPIIEVASLSPSLKILSSTSKDGVLPPFNDEFLEVPASWDLKLTKFVWNGGGESLVCNDTLLQSLQTAEEILLYSDDVHPSWVLDLLSSASSTLVSLDIPKIRNTIVDELPSKIELPNLVDLRLDRIPQSRSTQVSFFNILHAPNLRALCLGGISIRNLSPFPPINSLRRFTAFDLLETDGTLVSEAGEEEATSFVQAIKDWKQLHTLDLMLEGSGFSEFYAHLVDLLTPLSRKSVESGYAERPLLPDLENLILGDTESSATATPISSEKLVTLVGTRLGLWSGLSSDQISSIAAGDLSQVDQKPQGTSFASMGVCNCIRDLEINIPFKVDDETLSWLEENLDSLLIRHRIA